MANFSKSVLIFVSLLSMSACDGSSSGVEGKWERRYQDAVGQDYLEVLDIDEEGKYVKHAFGFSNDRGTYRFADGVITFTSSEDERNSREAKVVFSQSGIMVLEVQPFDFEETWHRSTLSPNYSTEEMSGRSVPVNLPEILKSVYSSAASTWQADVIPTRIDIEELASGYYEVVLSFISPSSSKMLRVEITPYMHSVTELEASRAAQSPLTHDFLDLPSILNIVRNLGYSGDLVRASIANYGQYGSVWTGNSAGLQGFQVSAETGDYIDDDITGYLTQYEADWDAAAAIWRETIQQFRSNNQDEMYFQPIIITSKEDCEQLGYRWTGGCNNN